jgi:hypothetical protein
VGNSGVTGPQAEKMRVKQELEQIFAFSTCLSSYIGGTNGMTTLIRS